MEKPVSRTSSPVYLLFPLLAACTNACTNDGDDTGKDTDGGGGDACVTDVTMVAADAISTVGIATWTTCSAGTAWVEFGPDTSYGYSTNVDEEARTDHEIVVAGFPAATKWHYRVASEVDGEIVYGPDATFNTKPASADLPVLTNTRAADYDRPGFVVGGTFSLDTAAYIINDWGQYVWWMTGDSEHVYGSAQMSNDRKDVLFFSFGTDRSVDQGEIYRVSLDQSKVDTIRTELGHHDFVELPQGGYAYLKLDIRDVDGEAYVGDSIVELDEDGNLVREAWNAWDYFPTPTECDEEEHFYPQGCDWLHGNSLTYDEASGVYLYSSHTLDTIYVIDATTGEVLWSVGRNGSWTIEGGDSFQQQHEPYLLENGDLIMFDNTATREYSRAVEYSLDAGTETATQVWEHEVDCWSFLMGDVYRYEDGNTFIGWGSCGALSEVTPDGDEVWRVDFDVGYVAGFSENATHLGGPR